MLFRSDTECHPGAVDNLMAFSRAHPEAGITGGRTVYPDGTLNAASCFNRSTLWSVFCMSSGLTAAFRGSEFFNPEGIGRWPRDSVREVDVVVGCFLMIRRELWNALGGFDLKYFMYGEDADLCLRAQAMGYRPMITPEAEIMHLIGASSDRPARKLVMLTRGRITLLRQHWPAWQVPLGVGLIGTGVAMRLLAARILSLSGRTRHKAAMEKWRHVWSRRREWLPGYTA